MKRLQSTVVLALLVLGTASAANEYPLLGHKMLNTRADPFRWYLDSRDPRPANIDLAAVETATRAAFDAWESVPGAYVDFEYMGRTGANPQIGTRVADPYDAFNVSTIWVNSNTDPFYALALGSGAQPTGSVPLTYAGYLYQCDIFINNATPASFRWTTVATTDPTLLFLDLQSALTHEIGHCMGLSDVYYPDIAVMYSTLPKGRAKRTLDVHDQEHVSFAYPENGAVGSPCDPSDPCTNGLQCIPRLRSDGGVQYRYCSRPCPNISPGECPDPFVCRPNPLDGGTMCLAVPNEAVTQVGKPCDGGPDCGGAGSLCQKPIPLSMGKEGWEGGYCMQSCTSGGSASCPAGAECVPVGGGESRCLKTCRVGSGDCRPGYTCSPLAQGNVCVPNCYSDTDCGAGFTCRICDRICIQNTGTSRTVGDPCSATQPCGVGQVCLKINDQTPSVCAQACSNATCSCPNGSSCLTVGSERMCMRNCSPGSCPQGLECNPVGEGYACIPACQKFTDCPTGWACNGGLCTNPLAPADGGCTLCNDGGAPPPPPPPPVDGGPPGDDTPEGCGCAGGPGSALLFLAVIALLLMGGRHSWSRH